MPLEMTHQLDGYEFGTREHPVVILTGGYDPGATDSRTQDVENPVGDGNLFGQDWLTAPEMAFSMAVVRDTAEQAHAALAELASAWRADKVRKSPGAVSTLRFYRGGRWWRVYGRPRKFAARPKEFSKERVQLVEATFKLMHPVLEVDDGQPASTVTLQLVAGPGDGGLVLPADVPFDLEAGSQARENYTSVAGVLPPVFVVTIKGPVSGSLTDARVYGPGWSFSIGQPIAWDQTVRIDTRTQTVTLNGSQRPGLIGPRDRLTARLALGNQTIGFSGNDPTNSATATVAWRAQQPL